MKKALVLSLVFLLVGCNGKKKIALAWKNELKQKREKGIPVKCPFCENGWGYILENESYDDPVYCIWKGPTIKGVYIDNDNLYWGLDDNPITIDEESSMRGFILEGPGAIQSGDTLERYMKRYTRFSGPSSNPDFCRSQFTYNQSLDEWDRLLNKEKSVDPKEEAEMKEFLRKRRENAKKSPEQIELEKITKELKELKEEVKKKK